MFLQCFWLLRHQWLSKHYTFSMSAKEDTQKNLLEGIGDIVEDERTKKDLAKYGEILSTLLIPFSISIDVYR